MSLWKISIFLQIFAVSLVFSANFRREVPETLGLYDANDQVEELTANNFDRNIYGSDRAWLVEFYNSWCGHCRNYAPTYKKIAEYFKNFKDVFIIAAIDCANDINQEICREFEIMGYPTLRYFHENYVKGAKNLGNDVEKSSLDNVNANVRSFVNVILEEQKNNRGMHIPPMGSYNYSDTSKLFDGKLGASYTILILENSTSMYGIEAIISYHKIPMVDIKYSNNVELSKYLNVNTLPHLVIFNHITKNLEFKIPINTIKQIEHFLMTKGINANLYKPNIKEIIQTTDKQLEQSDNKQLIDRIKLMGDAVFLADLETALQYSLRKEVARTKNIEGEKIAAFKLYLQVINKYFPLNENSKKLIQNLTSLTNKDTIYGVEVFTIMKASDNVPNLWSSKKEWLRCIGSDPSNRGYPCGLWTMFHFLTVAGADNQDPREVLNAMHGYIKNFFGCTDCSQHFQQMAIDRKLNEVTSGSQSILWLWAAHNQVNKRLAGNPTEDPQFPKKQFPLVERCPECSYRNGSWNENEVEKYLRHIYSIDNLRKMDSASLIRMKLEDFQIKNEVMGSIDLSMFIILYFVSFLLLIILIRMFLLKRGYRKKPYVHDLLGKV